MLLIILASFLGFSLFLLLRALILPPKNFPRNIPVIPFYVTFITLFKNVDQIYIYKTYLQKPLNEHGACAIYFGSRWNILIQRPEYLQELFKDVKVYEKSGNQKKVPYSILADYTGDNIISAHGENWRKYRKIMQPGLQKNFDSHVLNQNASSFVNLIRDQASQNNKRIVTVQQLIQRYTLANVSDELLGINLEVSCIYVYTVYLLCMHMALSLFKRLSTLTPHRR